jgi:hypothetical protein
MKLRIKRLSVDCGYRGALFPADTVILAGGGVGVSGMTSLLAIPCSVMNLASRSDAEDSNTLEITGFGALISIVKRQCQMRARLYHRGTIKFSP